MTDTFWASKLKLTFSVQEPETDRICKIGVFGFTMCEWTSASKDEDWSSPTVSIEQEADSSPSTVTLELELPKITPNNTSLIDCK